MAETAAHLVDHVFPLGPTNRLHLVDGRFDQILYLLPGPDLAGRTALLTYRSPLASAARRVLGIPIPDSVYNFAWLHYGAASIVLRL